MFGDERSIYQFILMKLGSLSGSDIGRPIYNNRYMHTIAIVPSRLMAAFADRYLLDVGKKISKVDRGNVTYLSPLIEKPLKLPWPSPITQNMNWNDLGRGNKAPETIKEYYELSNIVRQLATEEESILLISAKEMDSETAKTISILQSFGFQEVANDSLKMSNQKFPSLRARCFEATDRIRVVSDRGCIRKNLSRTVSGGTQNE